MLGELGLLEFVDKHWAEIGVAAGAIAGAVVWIARNIWLRRDEIAAKKLEQDKELAQHNAESQYKVANIKNGGIDGDTHKKVMDDVSSKLDELTKTLTAPKKVVRDAKGKIQGWSLQQ